MEMEKWICFDNQEISGEKELPGFDKEILEKGYSCKNIVYSQNMGLLVGVGAKGKCLFYKNYD